MSSSVTYTAVLDMRRETVLFVSGLLHTERRRRRRSLGCFAQAVLVIRWFIDGARVGNRIRCPNAVRSDQALSAERLGLSKRDNELGQRPGQFAFRRRFCRGQRLLS